MTLRGGGVRSFRVSLYLYRVTIVNSCGSRLSGPRYGYLDISNRDEIIRSYRNSSETFWFVRGAHVISPSPADRRRQLFRFLQSPRSRDIRPRHFLFNNHGHRIAFSVQRSRCSESKRSARKQFGCLFYSLVDQNCTKRIIENAFWKCITPIPFRSAQTSSKRSSFFSSRDISSPPTLFQVF